MTDSGKLSVLHMVTTGLSIVDDNIEDGTYNSKIRALAALGSVVSHERAAILEALKEKAERDNPKPLSAEGCEYCKDGVYYDVLGTPCKYNYCPICGKLLTEKGD